MRLLEEMDASPAEGYVPCLMRIVQATQADSGVRVECRQLAALSLKNVVIKCWLQRKDAMVALGDADKASLKEMAQSHFLEPDKKVAVQLAVIAAKVASKDWHQGSWPTLFPALFAAASSPCAQSAELSWLQQARAMATLDCVLDELYKKKLPVHQQGLVTLCAQCFPHLQTLWQSLLTQLLPYLQHVQQHAAMPRDRQHERLCQHLAITTRALCKVLQWGFLPIAQQTGDLGRMLEAIATQVPVLRQLLRRADGGNRGDGNDHGDDGDDSGYDIDADEGNSGGETSEEAIEASGGERPSTSLRVLVPSVRRVVRDLCRLPADLLKDHPLAMAPYVEPFLHFFYAQIVDEHSAASGGGGRPSSPLQALSIPAVLFLSGALQCDEYSDAKATTAGADALRTKERARDKLSNLLAGTTNNNSVDDEAVSAAATYAASQGAAAKRAFFTPARMATLLELLLHRLLRYSPGELEEWDSAPEHFATGQEESKEGDSVKSASEGLFVAMIDPNVSPCAADVQALMVAHLQNTPLLLEASREGASEDHVFFWDAVFLCTGLGSYSLGGCINADEWLANVLGPLLPVLFASPACGSLRGGQQLLRARLLWLIRLWLYHFDPQIFGQLVAFLVTTLDKSNGSDVVVRIEATKLIEQVIVHPKFDSDLLLPVIVPVFEALCALTNNLDEAELQAPVVHLMGALVDTMGPKLRLLLEPLAQHLQALWQASEPSSPVRGCIIDTLIKMVQTAGKASASLHGLALPLVAHACSGDESTGHLSASGVSLCLAVMRNLPSADAYCEAIDSMLLQCVRCLFSQLGSEEAPESGSHLRVRQPDDDARHAMLICEAYAITDGPRLLYTSPAALQECLLQLMGKCKANLVPYVVRPIEALFLSCPGDAGRFLLQSGVLLVAVRICAASVPQFATILSSNVEEDVVLVMYLSIFARMLLADAASLMPACQMLCTELLAADSTGHLAGLDGGVLVKCLIRLMLDKFDAVGSSVAGVWRRRLWSLALLSLYPQTPVVYEWFAEVYNVAVDVLTEEGTQEGALKKSQLLQTIMGGGAQGVGFGDDEYDDDDDGDEFGGAPKADEEPEPIVATFDRLFSADVVMLTDLAAVLQDKAASMNAQLGGTPGR